MIETDRRILQRIQLGLPLVSTPYQQVAQELGLSGSEVMNSIGRLQESGVIRRFGVVVRHRELGYTSNAMCVWDVPDHLASEIGHRATEFPFVTLCYRRKRSLPAWPYNFYCMIHAKSRDEALRLREKLEAAVGLDRFPSQVLISKKCYKQRGAWYRTDLDEIDKRLMNELQNGIPVSSEPYLEIARKTGLRVDEILRRLESWKASGVISRFGPMFNVEKFGGVFILAAMEVPTERFEEVNEIVNAFPEVAHNYEREHRLNMWFVIATSNQGEADEVIAEIEKKTGLHVYSLPKEKEFFLELKFQL